MPDVAPTMPSSSSSSMPTSALDAAAQAKAAFEQFRQQQGSPATQSWGQPGFSFGPLPFGAPSSPFPFPPVPGMMPFPPGPSPLPQAPFAGVGTSLFQSLGTMLRLGIDLVNSGLQGLAAAGETVGGPQGRSMGCGCGGEHPAGGGCGCRQEFEYQSCCGCYYARPGGCCMPSVRNCP
jgi:hypothetical protein